jgi:hypothetical protein
VKTYYQLLGVADVAPADEIKRAFRREIARYHPDKVQHLGTEFQDIAAVRASELTEAYRVLMDEAARRVYDCSLTEGKAPDQPAVPQRPFADPEQEAPQAEPAESRAAPHSEPAPPIRDSRFQKERATTSQFVRKASLSRLCEAVAAVGGSAVAVTVDGFDAAFDLNGKAGLFKKAEVPLRLLARFAPHADAAAIEECWLPAVKGTKGAVAACLLLLGASGMAPAKDLSLAVSAQRHKTRTAGPILVPVDVRDWDALFPPDAPASVRAIVQWMKQKV